MNRKVILTAAGLINTLICSLSYSQVLTGLAEKIFPLPDVVVVANGRSDY